jgi:hypothetical protein
VLTTTSLTVTSKGQLTLRKDLLAHLGIQPGLLAGRSCHRATLEEISEAAAAGWAGAICCSS